MQTDTNTMAVFCDFENIALGVRDAKYAQFDIHRVLERLLIKGTIVVKKAYCDWQRYKEFKGAMHEASFELIEIPHVRQSGKNSADIRMVVDALDLCYTKSHVSAFVVISGDSDFSPLVSKLRENNKVVIGVGVKNSTSDLLIANCDEFIYYDDLVREDERKRKTRKKTPGKKKVGRSSTARKSGETAQGEMTNGESAGGESANEEPPIDESANDAGNERDEIHDDKVQIALDLVIETVEELLAERGGDDPIWGSMVKQTIKRRKPGFSESYYGFRSFSKLLEAARTRGLLLLELDDRSGGYVIKGVAVDD